MVGVVLDVARSGDIDAEVHAVGTERIGDAGQNPVGCCLVVHRVERGDEVERLGQREIGHIADFEGDVVELPSACFSASGSDRFFGEVEAVEAAVREGARHHTEGVAGAAADVGDIDTGLESSYQSGDERQCPSSRVASIVPLESSAVIVWNVGYSEYGTPPPLWKHSTTWVSTPPSIAAICRDRTEVADARRPSQGRRVFGGQAVGAGRRVVFDDVPCHHCAEPLPHVPLVASARVRDLIAGRRRETGEGVEEARAVSVAHRERECSCRARRGSAPA